MSYHMTSCKQAGSNIRPQWAREQGFALIEVVVASLILGIAVAGIALMLSAARSFTVAQGDDRVAFYLAQEKVENLRALGFAAVPTISGPCPGTTCYNETGLTAGEDQAQAFSRATAVVCVAKSNVNTAIACPTPPVLKRITVTVPPAMHQADPVVMTTVLACQQC